MKNQKKKQIINNPNLSLKGLDVHDVGGYLKGHPPKPTLQGFTSLRFARDLKAGMYVTIEPGCYFIKHVSCFTSKKLIVKNSL